LSAEEKEELLRLADENFSTELEDEITKINQEAKVIKDTIQEKTGK
jgi:hypothetical protein